MKQPKAPNQEDCCNSGCNPCIFDVYEKQLKLYEKFLKSGETEILNANGISQVEYTSFVLVDKVSLCDSHIFMMFKRFDDSLKVCWCPGDHFLLKYNKCEKPCSRAYTPVKLSGKSEIEDYDFSIILKKYNNGLVSNYLYSMEIGELTLWRGPYGSYKMNSNFDRIIMIAQGTGIAPFLTIINEILQDEDNITIMQLYFCCKNENNIFLRDELYCYRSYWNFTYKIFLSEITANSGMKYQEPIENHRLSINDFREIKPSTDQFLICGSTEFTEYFKKLLEDNKVPNKNMVLF